MKKVLAAMGMAPGADGKGPKKTIRANLGDDNSFYYDETLKTWVDRNGSSDAIASDAAARGPPPTSMPPSSLGPGPGPDAGGGVSGGAPPPGAGHQRTASEVSASGSADGTGRLRCVLYTGPHTTAFAW